jgi:voltage-gated potassium channel
MNLSNDANITYPPTQKGPDPVRDYIYEVLILVLGVSAIINVTIVFLLPLPTQIIIILRIFDVFLTVTFIFDFLRNIYYASSRIDYLKWGWLDLLSGFPFIPLVRYARIRRIIEGIQLLRNTNTTEILKQYRLRRVESVFIGSIFISIFVILFSSILILRIESLAPNGNIETGEDALWWTLVTISTVGYGDLYPVTPYGRFLASIVIFFGVALFGMITSYITARFLHRRDKSKDIVELNKELKSIKATLARLEEILVDNQVETEQRSKNRHK